jgi:syntaxin-binding protein 1
MFVHSVFCNLHSPPMDIISITRNKIATEVLKFGTTKEDWRVFVYNESTARLLQNLFLITDILDYNILITQRLEADREPTTYPVLYFLEIDSASFDVLKKDIARKCYCFFYIVTINSNPYASKLDKLENVQYKECLLNFVPLEERFFTFKKENVEEAVLSISNVLGKSFAVSYVASQKTLAESLAACFEEGNKEDLILVDRSIDIFTPLIHYFTLHPMLEDLHVGEFEKDDDLWKKIRHVHMAEVNKILSKESKSISGELKALEEKEIDQKTLMKMVLQAPEKIKLKESLSKYLDLINTAFEQYEGQIKKVVEFEQAISTKLTSKGYKYGNTLQDAMNIFTDESITKENKLRVFLMSASQDVFRSNEHELLIATGTFTREEIKLGEEIKKFGFKASTRKDEYIYDISRYKPVLYTIITDLINNKSRLGCIGSRGQSLPSLRRTNFAFSKDRNRRLICVLFADSVTWAEVQVVYEISQSFNVDVIVGAPKSIIAAQFINDLQNGYFKPTKGLF